MMRAVSMRIVLSMVAVLIARSAQASVDITGDWTVVLQSIIGPLKWDLQFVQSGTDLTLTYTFSGGTPQGPFAGTIDPDAGTFNVPLPPSPGMFPCGGNSITGTAAPDSQSIGGIWIINTFQIHGCLDVGGPYTGVPAACGDGMTNATESCDDGNLSEGDCCSADCSSMLPNTTPCDDGDACTSDDQCSAGVCVGGPAMTCAPCEACSPSGCIVPETRGCQPPAAGKSSFAIRRHPLDASKDTLTWNWRSSTPMSVDDFGDPAGTEYTLCVIDRAAGVPTLLMSRLAPPGGDCGTKPCWKSTKSGYTYRDKEATPAGLTAVTLGASASPGHGKISVKGKGTLLAPPSSAVSPPLTVRLVRSESPICWESTFSTLKTNDGVTLTGR